ncbi:MAG: hypothetical protein ABIR57_04590 [Aeromicrobium sp.]
MRTISMFLTTGLFLFLGATATEAATTTNSYATATSSTSVDPQVRANVSHSGSPCSNILVGKDKMPVAICSRSLGRTPEVVLFDKTGKQRLTARALYRYSSSATIPAYLDQHGWLVLVNGDRVLWRLSHSQLPSGKWSFGLSESADLTRTVTASDSVVGLQPDSSGRVWFATASGIVGTANTSYNVVKSIHLKSGERIEQDIALSSSRVKVTSTRAVYTLTADSNGVPKIVSRTAR